MRDRWGRRTWLVGAIGIVGVALVIGRVTVPSTHGNGAGVGALAVADHGGAPAGTQKQFAFLAAQHSNFCGLQPSAVVGYADDQRIQGSCCNAMDMAKYQHQVQSLKRYASLSEIPADPYDIRAGLAKSLLDDDRSIVLAGANKATFDAAMQMTADKGPCCCHCWRWTATEGLDKRLITERHMGAAELARITDLVNGCGGPMDTPASPKATLSPRP